MTRSEYARRGAIAVAAALLFAVPSTAQRSPGLFRTGEPLPHLELPTIDGSATLDLAELGQGKKVLLIQFASW